MPGNILVAFKIGNHYKRLAKGDQVTYEGDENVHHWTAYVGPANSDHYVSHLIDHVQFGKTRKAAKVYPDMQKGEEWCPDLKQTRPCDLTFSAKSFKPVMLAMTIHWKPELGMQPYTYESILSYTAKGDSNTISFSFPKKQAYLLAKNHPYCKVVEGTAESISFYKQ